VTETLILRELMQPNGLGLRRRDRYEDRRKSGLGLAPMEKLRAQASSLKPSLRAATAYPAAEDAACRLSRRS